jgi:hypothetical protein
LTDASSNRFNTPERRNLVVVETPLQLLNAIEFREQAGLDDPILLVLLTPPGTPAIFDGMLRACRWRRVIFFSVATGMDLTLAATPFHQRSFLHEQYLNLRRVALRWRLDRFARRIGPIGTLVIGNYLRGHKDYIRHLANVISHRTLVLVDDGTDTLRVSEERRRGPAPPKGGVRPLTWKRRIRRRWLDLRSADAPALTYFSAFDVGVSGDDALMPNDFRHLRSRAVEAERTDEVYFVGQPLASDGYLPFEAYHEILRAIQAHFAPAPITYVAHPRESPEQLARLRAAAFEIVHFSRPLECELVLAPRRPGRLAGLFSTALHNCALIFGPDLAITCFEIPVARLGKLRDETAGIYDVLRRHSRAHFRVVPLSLEDGTRPRG